MTKSYQRQLEIQREHAIAVDRKEAEDRATSKQSLGGFYSKLLFG